ncbi:chitin-binding domain protein cbd-1-like [Anopheles aquasalis]|uniref:chitin-binding domain protein cbd-1-like n=1 Tax=Anopheles aquasalis TaxID=42839 RepID=UPI00215B10AF|nr:chitin-binding domain protein cbd-1-like [Anopheles aquasalis]
MAEIKNRVLLPLAIALLTVTTSVTSCRESVGCDPDRPETATCQNSTAEWTLEPSLIDCSVYLNCLFGTGLIICCPDGEYFNPETLVCEDSANVECDIICTDTTTEIDGAETTLDPDETTPLPEDTTTVVPEDTTTVVPEDTTTVVPEETTTAPEDTTTQDPDTTTLDPDTTTLDPDETTTTLPEDTTTTLDPEESTTEDQGTTEPAPETTTEGANELETLCAAQSSTETVEVPYPGHCNQYVVCTNREFVRVESCPAGLHFNPLRSVCDARNAAECLDFVCQDNPAGTVLILKSINTCDKYYICFGSMVQVRQCAPGTVYDPENNWCIVDNAETPCERERPPPPPESVIAQCRVEDELSKIRHPSLCAVYYRCINGVIIVRQCPAGLLFDTVREQCNPLITVAGCLLTTILAASSMQAQNCSNFNYTRFLADNRKCNYYTVCFNGLPAPLVCPSGYHFNADKQLCDYPSLAGCIRCPPAGFVNLTVDGSCTKFVQCFMGVALDRECPAGLKFDATSGQCNLAARVQCK